MKWHRDGKMGASISRKIGDGNYGSFEMSAWLESDFNGDTNLDEALDGLENWLTAKVAARIKKFEAKQSSFLEVNRELEDLVEGEDYGIVSATAEEGGEFPTHTLDPDASSVTEYEITEDKEIRVPEPENQQTFRVNAFVVAETKDKRDKYLQAWGDGPWSRKWVPAWKDVAELLFDDLQSMDPGTYPPPYDLEATVQMGTYKIPQTGEVVPSPDRVIEWTRIG